MSQQDWFDDEEDGDTEVEPQGQTQPNPRDLRNQLKQALKSNKELNAKLAAAEGLVRKKNIGDYFRSKGINPKLAKYVPADLDPSDDALEKWIEEDGELFNIKPVDGGENKPSDTTTGTQGTPGLTGDNITPEVQAGWNQINNTTANALPPGKADELLSLINNATDGEALKKLLFSHGASSF